MRPSSAQALGLALTAAALLASPAAHADLTRHALVIGANHGLSTEPPLRYAESDARRIARILRTLGGFDHERVEVLTGADADGVRDALSEAEARLRTTGAGDDDLLFVFYSGHADALALHLGGTRLPLDELRHRVSRAPAAARVLVVDACRSGAVTRVKGGRPGPSFKIELDDDLAARGVAILTSSAAGEDSQESDELGASFFTHFLASGLLGAADADADGRIGLNEAFAYASERTLAATASTLAGPQHPTYHVDLGGRRDLVLTRPSARAGRVGSLTFGEPGDYLVQRTEPRQVVVGEITVASRAGALAVPAGRYLITRRGRDEVREGRFAVTAGHETRVATADMTTVRAMRVASKGASEARSVALNVFATGGARGSVLDLGIAPRAEVGLGLQWDWLGLELRGVFASSTVSNTTVAITNHEAGAALAVLAHFDLDLIALGGGAELGVVWLGQRFRRADVADRDGSALYAGLLARAQVPLWRWLYARFDAALLVYFLQRGEVASEARLETPPTFRFGAGLGAWF